jgi:hypothetical protein
MRLSIYLGTAALLVYSALIFLLIIDRKRLALYTIYIFVFSILIFKPFVYLLIHECMGRDTVDGASSRLEIPLVDQRRPDGETELESGGLPEYSSMDPKESDMCVICMEGYENTEKCISLKCACVHTYHQACIDTWLGINRSCPTCKVEVHMVSV